jgi:hypothetical protein
MVPFLADMPLSRRKAVLGGAGLIVAVAAALGVVTFVFASVHGDLVLPHQNHVWLKDSVTIKFDQAIDTSQVKLSLTPSTSFTLIKNSDNLVLKPKPAWLPAHHYLLELGNLPNARHTTTLTGWHATFLTQDAVGVKAFKVSSGTLAGGQGYMKLRTGLDIQFTTAMNPSTVAITVNGVKLGGSAPAQASAQSSKSPQASARASGSSSPKASAQASAAPAPGSLAWSSNNTTATFTPTRPQPNAAFSVSVASGYSQSGDPMLAPAAVQLTTYGLEPSNGSSGITDNFATKTPIQIVVENSGPARPQYGLQQADIVYEYISEYSITRMTAMYFNNPPALIGPVRSCRLINIPLNQAFYGAGMCSGVSPGTHANLPTRDDPRRMHVIINDYDNGNHFFRAGFQFAPHNLFTDQGRALRWRAEENLPSPPYTIDPPHADNDLGTAAAPPSVPLHGVNYTYNAGTKTYFRFDEGAPFMLGDTHAQLQVKNVILMHVGFRYMSYVEDENGGARSVYYQMVGSGPAEIYSDGKMIEATWHMDQLTPVYFTDAQGNFIELNTGLTWIHVLGNGQVQ